MASEKILFPTDFSPAGDEALKLATSLARDKGAVLFIVHVEEPVAMYAAGEFPEAIAEPPTDELLKQLEEVKPADPSVKVEHRLLKGDPAEALVQFADDENVDMIVMGTHGRTGFSRLLMGSVAEHVVRKANCPVLSYKMPHK